MIGVAVGQVQDDHSATMTPRLLPTRCLRTYGPPSIVSVMCALFTAPSTCRVPDSSRSLPR